MKKGFTIVELITVIVLLSLIALFTYPVVTKTIKNRNEDLYNIQINNIKEATLSYVNKNSLLKDDPVIVTVCQLKQNGFLEENIKDPRDKTYIPDDSKVTVIPSENGNEFIYTKGTNTSEYCSTSSTTIFEYVEVSQTGRYVETIENISNYKIYVNNSTSEYVGNNYVKVNEIGTYFIEYKSSTKTIQKYVYVIDTTAPKLTYKENINGSKEIGNSLITSEANNSLFVPYEVVATDNSGEVININVTSNINTKIPGTYYINYKATDSSGNNITKVQSVKVVDTVSPVVTVSGYNSAITASSYMINVEASDTGSGLHPNGAYSFDGGKTYQTTNIYTVDKNQTLKIVVRDLVGNKTTKTININNIVKDDNDISFNVLNGTMKSNGWYITDIEVQIKPLLSENYFSSFSYCKTNDSSCTPNINKTSYNGTIVDITGNNANTVLCAQLTRKDGTKSEIKCSSNFRIDKTIPSVSISAKKETSGLQINSGVWSNENIVLTSTVSPSTTISEYTYAWYNGSTKVSDSLTYTATTTGIYRFVVTTGAGLSNEKVFVANIDKISPTCSLTPTGTIGTNNWYRSNVTLNGTFNDTGGSGISRKDVTTGEASYNQTTSYTINNNTSGTTVYCHVIDVAGNTGENSMTIKIDKVAPTCTFSISSDKVTGSVTCTDTGGSGIKDAGTTWPLTGTSNITKRYTSYDNAGNSTTVSKTFYYSSCATGSNTCSYGCSREWDSCASKNYYCNYTYSYKYYGGCSGSGSGYATYNSAFNACEAAGRCTSFLCVVNQHANCSYYTCSGGNVNSDCSDCYYGSNTCEGGFNLDADATTPTVSISAKKQISQTEISSGVWSNENIVLTASVNPSTTSSGYTYAWYNGSTKISNSLVYIATTNGTYKFVVTTGAGTSTEATFDVNIDKIAPICSLSVTSGTIGTDNWYRDNVTVTGTFTDNGGSGVLGKNVTNSSTASYNGNTTYSITSSTSGTTVYCYVTDSAGNTGSNSKTIKIDKTSPSISITGKKQTSGTSLTSGSWSNENVTLTASVIPSTTSSGYTYTWYKGTTKLSATGITYTANESGTYKFVVTTGSGISAEATFVVNIDKTNPTCSLAVTSGTIGTDNWYRDNVTVTGTFSDTGGSGVSGKNVTNSSSASYSGNTTYSVTASTNGTTVYCYVKDAAGNTGSNSKTIKIDKTSPSIAITGKKQTSGTSLTSGSWSNENVVLTASITPSTTSSGYTYAWYKDNVSLSHTSSTYSAVAGGTYKVVVTTGSGNRAEATFVVNIDKTNPTCSLSVTSGTLGNNNWYKTNVTLTGTFSDTGGSGVSGKNVINSSSASYSGNTTYSVTTSTNSTTVYCYVKDAAGNTGSNSKTIKIDKTSPSISITGKKQTSGTSLTSGSWSNENVVLTASVTPSTTSSGYTYTWYKGTTKLSATGITYTANESGTYKFVVTTGSGISAEATFVVNIDKTNPTCSLSVTSGTLGNDGWYRNDVTLTGTFSDTGGSGVSGKNVTNSSSASYSGNTTYSVTASTNGTTVYCYVKDAAGNTGSNSKTIKIDKTSPSIAITGKKQTSGTSLTSGSWSNENVVLTASVTPSTTSSGYTYAWYKDNVSLSHTSSTYSAVAGGTYKVVVTTGSGNRAEATFVVNIDKTNPTCSLSVTSGTLGNNNWYKTNVTLTGTFSDTGGSGVSGKNVTNSSSASYSGNTTYSVTTETKGTTVYCYVKDSAGNVGSNSKTIKIDKTAPQCSATMNGTKAAIVTCSDTGGSGTTATGTTWELSGTSNLTKSYTSTDAAGNTTTISKTFTYNSCASGSNTCQYGCNTVWDDCAIKKYRPCVCEARKCGKTASCSPYSTDSSCSGSGYPIDCGCYRQNCSYYDCYGGWVDTDCSDCYGDGSNTCAGGFTMN